MRTTLTVEDDLARRLKELARASGRSFKEVVNEAIRRGLSVVEDPPPELPRFRVRARACGFRAGIDPARLNQLYDEMELQDATRRMSLEVNES